MAGEGVRPISLRHLVSIEIELAEDGASLAQTLIGRRLAVPYRGQAKRDIAELHDRNVAWLLAEGQIEDDQP
ncbi:MAG: hypothetical protein OXP73_01945 [Chloroflexota bacterium]|nr:hypothetical protein [Chloroflexota bacterium]